MVKNLLQYLKNSFSFYIFLLLEIEQICLQFMKGVALLQCLGDCVKIKLNKKQTSCIYASQFVWVICKTNLGV